MYLPSLTLTSCVALDKLLALSEPQEPELQNGDTAAYLLRLCKELSTVPGISWDYVFIFFIMGF